MRGLVCGFVLAIIALPCGAQTLGDELNKAGIPAGKFSSAELAQGVNAASARDGDSSYLVYMRVNASNMFTGYPQAVRYDEKGGTLVRKELPLGEKDNCCGSPLGIHVTRNYRLFEFHLSPSASTIVVTDSEFKPVELLYGFGTREIAADEVIFSEDMVHFAPAHPERLMLVDLRSGAAQELYPPKGDALRAAFAREHKKHMPAPEVCAAMNDPCRPDYYDEAIELRNDNAPERFTIRVSRDAVHAMTKDGDPDSVVSDHALYVYQRQNGRWFYCAVPLSDAAGETPECQPSLPVTADGQPEFRLGIVRKVN